VKCLGKETMRKKMRNDRRMGVDGNGEDRPLTGDKNLTRERKRKRGREGEREGRERERERERETNVFRKQLQVSGRC